MDITTVIRKLGILSENTSIKFETVFWNEMPPLAYSKSKIKSTFILH